MLVINRIDVRPDEAIALMHVNYITFLPGYGTARPDR
jgi:hypothetical protein